MSKKQNKSARRKEKHKVRKVHIDQARQMLADRIANAVMELCAAVLPEYVDDSKGPDLTGRNILWRMGMIAWDVAVSGRKEISDDSIRQMNLDAESQKMVRDEVNRLVREKYTRYPELRTSINEITPVLIAGVPRLKVFLGETFPEFPIPEFDEKPQTLTPEEILTKRKELKLSQAKFAAELGVSVKKLSAWEHGKAVPTAEELEKLNSYIPAKE